MRTTLLISLSALALGWPCVAAAQPSPGPETSAAPGAPRLLPEQTLAYLRIESVDELRSDLAASSIGQMMSDPKLRPFASDLFATAGEAFAQVSSELGVSLQELLAIPHGQLAVGVVLTDSHQEAQPPPAAAKTTAKDDSPEAIRRRLAANQQRPQDFGVLVVIETGEDNKTLVKILETIETRMIRSGFVARTESVGKTPIRRLLRADNGRSRLEYCHRGGTTLIGIGDSVASDALARWDGQSADPTLAESTDFAAVMGRCIGAADTRPQITFFADPYRLVRRAVQQGGVAAALIWPIFEDLGIAKVRGIGGSTFHGGETFADIAHAHILIDPPRDGFFSVLRPQDGDTNPPAWVPADVTGYTSIGWRVEPTYDGLGRILDRFQGEGALNRLIEEPYRKRVGGDFRKSIIQALDDRVVMISWLQPPIRVNSSVSINAVKLKDVSTARATIDELQKAFPSALSTDAIGTTTLYRLGRNRPRMPEGLRQPEPCAVILGDWLLTSDSREFIERAIRAQDGAIPRLVELPEYDLMASELGGQLGGDKPFLLSFTRTAEVLRQLYELAKSDQTKAFLQTRGERSDVARGFSDLLRRNQLPPFEEFKKYFAPSGGFAYDEPSGIHFGHFTLKPE